MDELLCHSLSLVLFIFNVKFLLNLHTTNIIYIIYKDLVLISLLTFVKLLSAKCKEEVTKTMHLFNYREEVKYY